MCELGASGALRGRRDACAPSSTTALFVDATPRLRLLGIPLPRWWAAASTISWPSSGLDLEPPATFLAARADGRAADHPERR